jgi:spore coat protein A, manganese oxidase
MNRFTVSFGRFAIAVLLTSFLSLSSVGQVQLREALDFDGDQKADFSTIRPAGNVWWIKFSSGSHRSQPWGIANDDRPVPGDYDGDNKADIAVFRDATATWWVLRSSDFTYTATKWGIDGDEPVARDYDGDGRTDYAIARRTNGKLDWWILKSTGGHSFISWGLDIDFVCPGNYDNDDKFDLCVQRPGPTPSSPAFFYILGSQAGFIGVPWGLTSDFIAPGDYDGDGKTDIAVVREGPLSTSPLTWWIRRSDGQGHFTISFGITGDDFITQGDYDGNGRTEAAIWRQSTATFWTIDAVTRVQSATSWGVPGDLPVASYDTH